MKEKKEEEKQRRSVGRGEDRKKRGRVMGNINKASKKNSKRKQVRTYLTAFGLESEFILSIYVG